MTNELNTNAALRKELKWLQKRVTELEEYIATEMPDSPASQIELAKQEWEATVDALPQLVCLLNRNQEIVRANRTIERWNVGQVTQVKGRKLSDLLPLTSDGKTNYLEKLLNEAWDSVRYGQHVEDEVGDQRRRRFFQIQLRPIVTDRRHSSSASFAAVIIQDITRRKQLEATIRGINEGLERRVKDRTAELAKANEELRESEQRYRWQADELRALNETSLRLNAQLKLGELLNLIAEQVVKLLRADAGGVYLYKAVRDELKLSVRVGDFRAEVGETYKAGNSAIGKILKQHPTRPRSASMGPSTIYAGMAHLNTVLAVPLLGSQGILGVLSVGSNEKADFDEHEEWLAELFAAQAVVALENAHLHAQMQTHARKLAALNSASQTVLSTLDLNAVLRQIMIEIKTLLSAADASVLLYEEDIDKLRFASVANQESETLVNTLLPLDNSIAGWVMRNEQSALTNNPQEDERFYSGIDNMTGSQTESLLAAPLLVKGKVIGVVEVINTTTGYFEQSDLEILRALVNSAAIAIENARLYEAEREQYRLLQESQNSMIQIEKMAALGRLVGSIAHEINNPLQSVQGFMALLREELRGRRRQDKVERYLNVGQSEIERIAGIVKRMRSFYRPSSERAAEDGEGGGSLSDFYKPNPTELEPINLNELLESVLQLTNKKLQETGIVLVKKWGDAPLVVRGHADYLKQVFLNLTLNAIDAMEEQGGGELIVHTYLEEMQLHGVLTEVAQIIFEDTGIGMSEENQSRIFEPLFTTKKHGSGFGLFTSYKIIEAHCGHIKVESGVGEGTSFIISLPVDMAQHQLMPGYRPAE